MEKPTSPPPGLSPVKQALVEIRRLRQELESERHRRTEPIALVGAGIRAPGGVASLGDFSRLLLAGEDAVGPIPGERWPHARYFAPGSPMAGKYYVEKGGFLDAVDRFDPEFFGIAPLEAATMDPQQRLLLETMWESLEDAGIPAAGLRGTRSGVFVGIGTTDYQRMVLSDPARVDTYAATGTAFSVASGRIAYLLGLEGPALSVDTACSSSLVAVHLACQSLRSGESDLALAGGVNLILSPELTINFCQAGMLSPDGKCKTFDAAADGYVRSEGCGMVVLKRLGDARRDGDRVLAVIRGSAVNQDGRSSGLTAPSGSAQEAVIRDALAAAGLRPADIGYVEAHGTGTSLGDPIEMQALGAVFSGEPRERPLVVGSAKTNLGHLEAAAGIVGLLKTVLALRQREIPPHLHFETPSPRIPWDGLPVEIPVRRMPFHAVGGGRRAGVSSFGFSGTNAHVILEEAPEQEAPARSGHGEAGFRFDERPVHILTLSAPHEGALRALAGEVATQLEGGTHTFPDVCSAANTGRTHFRQRLALVAPDGAAAAAALRGWMERGSAPGLFAGHADGRTPALAFVTLPGEAGTTSLHHSSPVVRESLLASEARFREAFGVPVLDAVERRGPGDGERSPELGAACRSAVQAALGDLWKSWGVTPDVVVDGVPGAGPGGHASALAAEGVGRIVLLGADVGSRDTGWADALPGAVVVGARGDGSEGWRELLEGMARLYVDGLDPDWRALDRGHPRTKVPFPGYPFQRRRFWLDAAPGTGGGAEAGPTPWEMATGAALERAGLVPLDVDLSTYPATWSILQELAEGLGRNTLLRLGAFGDPGRSGTLEAILDTTGIGGLYRPIVRRWLEAMERAGELERSGDVWSPTGPLSERDEAPLWEHAEAVLAADPPLLRYVRNSGERLQEVLTGRMSPLETLFPDGSFELARDLYASAAPLRYVNGIAASALRAWVQARPADGAVRILEVGAGTGGTTRSLVPVLPAGRATYDYTDVSDIFLDFGRRTFEGVDLLRTRFFDLEKEPGEQGVEPGSYDVVVGSNVIHAVRNLRVVLERVRSLLAPGGLLLLVESTGHHAWHDITTGLIEGWQHFEDDIRTDTPLLPTERWRELLDEAGFVAVEAAPPEGSPAGVLKQHVILAMAPETAPGAPGEVTRGAETAGVPVDAVPARGPDPSASPDLPRGERPLVERLGEGAGKEGLDRIMEVVRGCVMEVLRWDPERPPSKDARLMELGVDSLMAVRLRNVIQERLELPFPLPSTLVFDHPTIRHIARLVLAGVAGGQGETAGEGPRPDSGVERGERERQVEALSDAEVEALLLERLDAEDRG